MAPAGPGAGTGLSGREGPPEPPRAPLGLSASGGPEVVEANPSGLGARPPDLKRGGSGREGGGRESAQSAPEGRGGRESSPPPRDAAAEAAAVRAGAPRGGAGRGRGGGEGLRRAGHRGGVRQLCVRAPQPPALRSMPSRHFGLADGSGGPSVRRDRERAHAALAAAAGVAALRRAPGGRFAADAGPRKQDAPVCRDIMPHCLGRACARRANQFPPTRTAWRTSCKRAAPSSCSPSKRRTRSTRHRDALLRVERAATPGSHAPASFSPLPPLSLCLLGPTPATSHRPPCRASRAVFDLCDHLRCLLSRLPHS